MATEKKNQPQSPEDLAKAAQEAAIKAAMEQSQALFGNIPGYQMPDMQAMQEQLMAQMQAAVPDWDEVQKRQAEQLAAAGIGADTLAQAFSQNMAYAREVAAALNESEEDENEAGANPWFEIPEEEWEINLKDNRERVNTIDCESDIEIVQNTLESWWNVVDHDSTFDIAKWLLEEGHHADADHLLQSLAPEDLKRLLEEGLEDEDETAETVRLIMQTMLDNGYCTEDNLPQTALAWDLVRVVNLARWAYLCGYISEEEMWQVMGTAAGIAHERFASWEEYGLSFVFGRGVWHGEPADSETAYEIVSTLLEKDESPWKQLAW